MSDGMPVWRECTVHLSDNSEADTEPQARTSASARVTASTSATTTAVRVWYLDRGADRTLLCLHGLGGDHRGLESAAESLPHVNLVIPDLPGYGASPPMAGEHSLIRYADLIAKLRTSPGPSPALDLDLAPKDGLDLLGHSLGASIALVHAARHGDGLRSVTLVNPVSMTGGLTANLGKAYYRVAAALPTRAGRFWLASRPAVYIADAFVIVTKDRALRRAILRQDYENYRAASVPAMVEAFLSFYDTPFGDLAAAVRPKTLVLTGDKDGIGTPASAARLAERMPSGRLEVLRGGGHLMPVERPDDVFTLVGEFLADT